MIDKEELDKLKEEGLKEDNFQALQSIAYALQQNGAASDIAQQVENLTNVISAIKMPQDKSSEILSIIKRVQDSNNKDSQKQVEALVSTIKILLLESQKHNNKILDKINDLSGIEKILKDLRSQLARNEKAEWEFSIQRDSNSQIEKVYTKRVS